MDNSGLNGNDLMANGTGNGYGNGTLTDKIKEINEIPENRLSLDQLLLNLVNSGDEKHAKLALDLIDLNLIKGNESEKLDKNVESDILGTDCFDKISVLANKSKNTEQGLDNNEDTSMDWTTVRPKGKRTRSNSNDSEKINIELQVSPNKKQKSSYNKTKLATGNDNSRNRKQLNKDSVLIVITEIPENTYFNSIKMKNMILNAFPRLKENGMWTKYRINKRHQCKCYITLPLDHLSKNVSEIIKSQVGFDSCKVKVIKGINNVQEKAHKVVAIGVHQTISEDDIKAELAKNNVKINKVQRLKFNGQPTRKVVIQFEKEQDMKIALFSGIYFGRMRIRCESYRTTPPPPPPVTQCYKCQGFNHVAKDCKSEQKCVRCAGAHKSTVSK